MAEKLNLKWVSDLIGDQYLYWPKNAAIQIESQTGTGKNTFISKELVIHAKHTGKRILYLCNRKSLKNQFKVEVAKAQKIDCPPDGIDGITNIGVITIYSYQYIETLAVENAQKLDLFAQILKLSQYSYIVFDECHYFMQDSLFNPFTNIVLPSLIKAIGRHEINRIYMSATLYEVESYKFETS